MTSTVIQCFPRLRPNHDQNFRTRRRYLRLTGCEKSGVEALSTWSVRSIETT